MKKLPIYVLLNLILFQAYSQLSPNYSISLSLTEQFKKITPKQIVDSLNLNQTGPEQLEYFEIKITKKDSIEVDQFMKSCRSIESIISRFGSPSIDIVLGSNSDLIRTLSGFYYSIGYFGGMPKDDLRLTVIYPRKESFK